MGCIRRVGDDYYIEFEARGLKYQQKAGTDKKQAQKLLIEIEAKINTGEMEIAPREVDTGIFFKDFLKFVKQNYSAVTTGRFVAAVGHFRGFLDSQEAKINKISQITPSLVEIYKIMLISRLKKMRVNRRNFIVNLTLLILDEMFEYAINLGYLNDNPRLHIPLVRHAALAEPYYINPHKRDTFLSHFPVADQLLARWVLETGMRRDEINCLQWEDVNLLNGFVCISGQRKVPLTSSAAEIIAELNTLQEGGDKHFLRFFLTQSALNNAEFYGLRNTFARNLLQMNVSPLRLQLLMGFVDFARILKYLAFFPDSRVELYG